WETTSHTTSSPPAHCTWWRPRWTSPPAPDPTSGRAASSTPGPDRGDARHGRPPSVFHPLNHPSVSTPPRTAPLPPLCSDYSLRSLLVHHPLSPGRRTAPVPAGSSRRSCHRDVRDHPGFLNGEPGRIDDPHR